MVIRGGSSSWTVDLDALISSRVGCAWFRLSAETAEYSGEAGAWPAPASFHEGLFVPLAQIGRPVLL